MVGDHGTAIMLARSGMMQGEIMSDCAPLNGLCEAILGTGAEVRVLRDPTRGGVATTLNEFIEGTALGIELYEDKIPVRDQVRSACDMLGLDPLYCANEGKLLAVAAADDAERVLSAMRETEEGGTLQSSAESAPDIPESSSWIRPSGGSASSRSSREHSFREFAENKKLK